MMQRASSPASACRWTAASRHIPVFNKSKVFDVTGAGDTVTALFSLAIAIGAPAVYAAVIGNIAAGIVVKQYGCATTTIKELLENLPSKISLEN